MSSVLTKKGTFAGNVLTLMTGTLLAQASILALSPVLTRLYDPSQYGIYSLFISLINIIGSLSTWRYDQAIVLPSDEDEAFHLLVASFFTVLGTIGLLVLFTLWGGQRGLALLGVPELIPFLWWGPVFVLVQGTLQGLNYWSTRQKSFRPLAISRVASSTVGFGSQAGYGLVAMPTAGGLLGGYLTGQIIAVLLLGAKAWRQVRQLIRNFTWGRLRTLMFRYRDVARYAPVTDFLNVVSISAIPLALNYYYSTAIVGLFMLGQKLVMTPSQIVVNATWQTTYSDLAQLSFEQQRSRLRRVHQHISFIFALPMWLVCLFPRQIDVIFGYKWRGLGEMAIPLAIMAYSNAVSNSVSYFVALKHFKEQALANLSLVAMRLAAIVVGGLYLSVLGTVYLFAGVSIFVYLLIQFRWAIYFADLRQYFLNMLGSLGLAILFLLPLRFLMAYASIGLFLLLAAVTAIGYYSLAFSLLHRSKGSAVG